MFQALWGHVMDGNDKRALRSSDYTEHREMCRSLLKLRAGGQSILDHCLLAGQPKAFLKSLAEGSNMSIIDY